MSEFDNIHAILFHMTEIQPEDFCLQGMLIPDTSEG